MELQTRQRTAIRMVLERAARPLSAREILTAAQADVPALGNATVYRTLKGLVAEGHVHPVDIPGEPPRYEIAGRGHHHHFHCEDCGRVFNVEGCPGNLQALAPRGFQLNAHEIFLYGRCIDCRRPPRGR